MAWVEAGAGRWRHDDDDRHLLLRAGDRFVEYEVGFVHVYRSPGGDPDNPLGDSRYVGTYERPDLVDADEAGLWQAMGADDYVKPAP
jgi:hypothetical protein